MTDASIPETDLDLLRLVASSPAEFLGEKSIACFNAFSLGFSYGLPGSRTFSWVNRPDFEAFVREQIPCGPERWPHNASVVSYIEFLSSTSAESFDRYVSLIEQYHASPQSKPKLHAAPTGGTLTATLEQLCGRPAMYFGSRDQMGCFRAFLNGWIASEKIVDGVSVTARLLDDYQTWMERRHTWSQGRPWHAMLLLQNLWGDWSALGQFRTSFFMFLSGEAPDAMTPMAKHLFETNAALPSMAETEREAWKRQLNRIFPG